MTPTRLLEIATYHLYLNTIIGNPPGKLKRTYEFMTNPRVGDLVLETSTIWREDKEREGTRIGRLLRIEEEYIGEGDDRAGPIEVWVIQLLDGREYRWTNADFVRIPESMADLR